MTKEKTILILGAGSDIAKAIARKFAAEGYAIQLAGRDNERLMRLQNDLESRYSITVSSHFFDAEDIDSHMSLITGLTRLPNIAVYVAGVMHDQNEAVDSWRKSQNMIAVNFSGAVSTLNILSSRFLQRGSGAIVGISSVAGERGRGSNYIYGSTKAAFTAYLSGLRNRLFKKGIHVLTVKPGFVYSKMTHEINLPAKLTTRPEKVADAIYKGVIKKKDVIYVKPIWRGIMLVIRLLPESIFKRTKL